MTTVAALFGALPLMLGSGMGAELRHPLGISIVGGRPHRYAQRMAQFRTMPVPGMQQGAEQRRVAGAQAPPW